MINNSTTGLEAKSSYTSVEKQKLAAAAPSAKSDAVAEAVPVDKQKPVEAQVPVPEQQAEPADMSSQQREEVTRRVAEAIPKVRELMQKNQRSLDFEVSEHENRIIITVIDKENDKVIRQIPPEDVLQIAEAIDQGLEQNLGGMIFNSRV